MPPPGFDQDLRLGHPFAVSEGGHRFKLVLLDECANEICCPAASSDSALLVYPWPHDLEIEPVLIPSVEYPAANLPQRDIAISRNGTSWKRLVTEDIVSDLDQTSK